MGLWGTLCRHNGFADEQALLARPVKVFCRVATAAQANLPDLVALQQAFFHCPAEGRAVGDALAEHVVVHVRVGIHIADVSHYVRPKTHLDTEALERGTSVYLVDRTIPMLPRALSDDLCSLLPHVDRLTMSAVITFGADGTEKGAWFGPTIIHSAERFTYESAQEVIDGVAVPPQAGAVN